MVPRDIGCGDGVADGLEVLIMSGEITISSISHTHWPAYNFIYEFFYKPRVKVRHYFNTLVF